MTSEQMSRDAHKRIKVMTTTTDGFEIAEVDLQLRGPGDIQGTQQSGIMDLKMADLTTDEPILARAREEARALLEHDPGLSLAENKQVVRQLQKLYPDKLFWSRIS
jgi:ATP-dependent DNA helicase RecG